MCPRDSLVICGAMRSVDRIARLEDAELGMPLRVMKASWDRHGEMAPVVRNREMLRQWPDVVLWFGPGQPRAEARLSAGLRLLLQPTQLRVLLSGQLNILRFCPMPTMMYGEHLNQIPEFDAGTSPVWPPTPTRTMFHTSCAMGSRETSQNA